MPAAILALPIAAGLFWLWAKVAIRHYDKGA